MTVQSSLPPTPSGLLTLADWAALPEDNSVRAELQEGVLIVPPRPAKLHQRTAVTLVIALDTQLPEGLEVLPEIGVVLRGESPPTVRIPDIVVAPEAAPDQLTAADILLAIEIISPGSAGLDNVMKRHEYAQAGIGHYWIVNPDRSMTTQRLGPDGTYEETGPPATGWCMIDEPFRFEINLAEL